MINPYYNRTAIREDTFFVGRERELADIASLVTADQPQSISIVGDRRIGKSSLLQALLRRLKNRTDCAVVYQDLQSVTTEAEFYRAVVNALAVAGEVSDNGDASADVLRRHVERLTARRRLVLLLDEFDAITKNRNFPVIFFGFLRSLPNSWPVSLILAAPRKIREMCYSEQVAGSPFFNIFHERRLGGFKREESLDLICRLSEQSGFSLASQQEVIVELAGDWPFFLQVVSYLVFEELTKVNAGVEPDLRRIEATAYDELYPHIEYLWKHLTDLERSVCAQAAVGGSLEKFSQGVVSSLVLRGILAKEEDRIGPSCQLFRTFLNCAADNAVARPQAEATKPIRVFVSYSHQDEKLIDTIGLLRFLSLMSKDGIEFWQDHQIATGSLWDDAIRAELRRTDIALLLVTQHFLSSAYCQNVEVREFLKARITSGLIVFPIIVSHCEWERIPWLKATQVQPTRGSIERNFKTRGKRDELYVQIAAQLREAVDRVRVARQASL